MPERLPDDEPAATTPAAQQPPLTRPLAGAFSLKELEEREQQHFQRLMEGERQARNRIIAVSVAVVVVAAIAGLGWKDLNSKHFAVEKPLKRIRMETEGQLEEVLRVLPLKEPEDAVERGRLATARQDMADRDLRKQVSGIQSAREVLEIKLPRAHARLKAEFEPLSAEFQSRNQQSDAIVRDRATTYNKAASEYNRASAGFPGVLIRSVVGFESTVPPLEL